MKTIKLLNYEIESIVKALGDAKSIMNTNDDTKKLPISVLWKMDENMEKLRAINTKIQNKRGEIESSFADDEHSYEEVDENGNRLRKVKTEYFNNFNKQMQDLMMIENEVSISMVDISVLEDMALVPNDYRSIRFMLENNTEDEDDTELKVEKVELKTGAQSPSSTK